MLQMNRISYKRKWYHFALLSLLLVGLIASIQLKGKRARLDKNLEIFADILKTLSLHYVDEVDLDATVKTGINAMLYSLDPYTNFFSGEDLESFQTSTTGKYGGIGALIGKKGGRIRIVELYKYFPAHQGGLRVGDQIVQINGEDVAHLPVTHAANLLKGMPNTSVQLSVMRHGVEKPLAFTLTREKVTLKNVLYHGHLQQDIGYIKLTGFATGAAEEVRTALERLKENGAKKLVLDLRSNPGGILEEAIQLVNLLLDQGLTVVATKSRLAKGGAKSYATTQPACDRVIPVIVLIDQNSASAAEIVAGVIQDYDRGILIGKSTFGKGLVQVTKPLSHNTQLKLTTAEYFIPSGRSIQRAHHSCLYQKETMEEKPEESRKVFKTQSGRKVYDGNGITPDIEVEEWSPAPVTIGLIREGLIFDYATLFRSQHDSLMPAREFRLSDSQYEHFLAWVREKDYTYTIEPRIDQLRQQAQLEAYSDNIQAKIDLLKTQVQRHKSEDLHKFKSEIKLVLQEAIAMRYYFREGATEAMLNHDKNIQKACQLFQDMSQYRQLLEAR